MTGSKKNIDSTFDIVEAKNQAKETVIKQGIADRKQARQDKEKRYLEDVEDIHKKYGYKVVELDLINKGFNIVHPFNCAKCGIVKAFPYDFLTTDKKDNGKNHCSQCMKSASETIKKCTSKNNVKCACGVSYYCTPLSQANHENTNKHLNNIRQLKIFNGKIYKQGELRAICSLNGVKDYKALTIDEMIEGILKVKDFKLL